jgi:septal ring factor EnvC (AmiA/AmiB activator)
MTKEEIKEYLKRVEELELKLTGEDKDTLQWLIYGYNECARLLNQLKEENIQLKIQLLEKKCSDKDIEYKEKIKLQAKVNQLETSIATKDSELLQLKGELRQLKTNIEEAIELLKNFDVFKEFSFPLMKRDEENQVKSSIDYEFKTTLYKQLSSILERGKE